MNQNDRDQQIQQAIKDRLLTRTLSDPEFRRMLIDNPKSALARELGFDVPDHIHITVLPETENHLFLVIPDASAAVTANSSEFGLDRLANASPSAYGSDKNGNGRTGLDRLAIASPSAYVTK